MLKTVFSKILFEKRWTILLWFMASLVSIIGISMIFPPIRDTMGSMMLGSVPESMKNWFGSAETWQTFAGFAGQEIYVQMSMLIVVMAIVFGAAFSAGDEGDGTLLMVLSRPVGRASLFMQKYAALFVMVTVVASTYFFGAVLGGWILSEPVPYAAFLQASVMVWLLGLSLATVTYAIGVATGRKGLAGLVVGFYAFVAYFIASLSTATDIVDKLSYGSLFRYVAAPEVIVDGLNGGHILVFVVTIVVSLAVALPIFMRRDLKTR